MKKIKYVHTVLLIVLFAFFLVNCSSGGGDSDDSENHGVKYDNRGGEWL